MFWLEIKMAALFNLKGKNRLIIEQPEHVRQPTKMT